MKALRIMENILYYHGNVHHTIAKCINFAKVVDYHYIVDPQFNSEDPFKMIYLLYGLDIY